MRTGLYILMPALLMLGACGRDGTSYVLYRVASLDAQPSEPTTAHAGRVEGLMGDHAGATVGYLIRLDHPLRAPGGYPAEVIWVGQAHPLTVLHPHGSRCQALVAADGRVLAVHW